MIETVIEIIGALIITAALILTSTFVAGYILGLTLLTL